MADKKPLWKLMLVAGRQGMNLNGRVEDAEAARLRAIADEIVPEEAPLLGGLFLSTDEHASWKQRMAIRAALLQAAAEAEGRINA
jgi:hypothetical protein